MDTSTGHYQKEHKCERPIECGRFFCYCFYSEDIPKRNKSETVLAVASHTTDQRQRVLK